MYILYVYILWKILVDSVYTFDGTNMFEFPQNKKKGTYSPSTMTHSDLSTNRLQLRDLNLIKN